MKQLLTLAFVVAMAGNASAQKQQSLHSGYPIDPVPFTSVRVTDGFWGQRLKASREVTIPLAFSKCIFTTSARFLRRKSAMIS